MTRHHRSCKADVHIINVYSSRIGGVPCGFLSKHYSRYRKTIPQQPCDGLKNRKTAVRHTTAFIEQLAQFHKAVVGTPYDDHEFTVSTTKSKCIFEKEENSDAAL